MTTSNTDKLNLRLVRADMYLSQFDLNIRHKSDRDHVIPNALSRLPSFEDFKENSNDDILKDIKTYVETMMKMSSTFKNRLMRAYETDKE